MVENSFANDPMVLFAWSGSTSFIAAENLLLFDLQRKLACANTKLPNIEKKTIITSPPKNAQSRVAT